MVAFHTWSLLHQGTLSCMKLNFALHSVACEYPTMEHIIPTLALHEEAVRCECLSGTLVISSVSSNVSVWFAAESPLQTFHTTTPSMIKPAATASVSTAKIQGHSMPWSPVFLMLSHVFIIGWSRLWRIASSQRPRSCNNDDGLRSIISSSRLYIRENHDI